MARTYKRDSRGRFAGGGGGSGGGGRTAKPAGGGGRSGPRGGKVGTRAEQARAKKAQAARTAQFRGKAAPSAAKAAYKAAQGAARKAGKVAAPTAKVTDKRARPKSARITDEKVARITRRVNNIVNNRAGRTGIKALNAVQVGVRAKDFLTRKSGGIEKHNALSTDQQIASIQAALRKPPRYSTQKPNRNRPGRFNALGQDKARATKARLAAQQAAAMQKPRPMPAVTPKTTAPKGYKLDAMQRSEAAYAKRKYGVRSTVSNPGRRSRRGKMTTTSSGARVMSTGRTRSQAGAAQSRKTRRLLTDMNPSGSRLRRQKKLPQLNIFGGADIGTYLEPAAKGPRRRYRTRSSSYSNSAPRGRYS